MAISRRGKEKMQQDIDSALALFDSELEYKINYILQNKSKKEASALKAIFARLGYLNKTDNTEFKDKEKEGLLLLLNAYIDSYPFSLDYLEYELPEVPYIRNRTNKVIHDYSIEEAKSQAWGTGEDY